MLFGSRCAVCGAFGDVVCASCAAALPAAPHLPIPLHLDACDAAFAYDDAVSRLLTGLKNRQRRDLVGWAADAVVAVSAAPPPGAVVAWVPTTPARRRARGFDQAELLARAVARRWGLSVRPALRRLDGPAQSGRSAHERHGNPRFTALAGPPRHLVLVDDVVTTGATMTAAARSLRRAGSQHVQGFAVARAPLPRRGGPAAAPSDKRALTA